MILNLLATNVFYRTLNFPISLRLAPGYLYLELFFYFATCFFLFNKLSGSRNIAIGQSIAVFLLNLSIYGFDFVSWRTCLFPALLVCTIYYSRALPLLAVVWCLFAGNLGVFGILAAVFISVMVFDGKFNIYMLLSILISFLFKIPLPEIPDYPGDAILVPLYSAAHTIFGPEHFYKYINQQNYKIILNQTTLTFLASLFLWLIIFRANLKNKNFLFSLLFVVLLFIGELSSYEFMPFKFLYRVVPGIAIFPFVWDLALISSTALFSVALKDSQLRHTRLNYFVFSIYCFAFIGLKPSSLSAELSDGIATSTSAYVLDYWGIEILSFKNRAFKKLNPITDFKFQVESNLNRESVNFIFDNKLNTRWSTKAAQKGGEQITVNFDKEIGLSKIFLNPGNISSDFPRGVRLELVDSQGVVKKIFEKQNWIGPVRFTEKGYPYFGPQSQVEIILPETEIVRSLILTQISSDKIFDWSFAELELYSEARN